MPINLAPPTPNTSTFHSRHRPRTQGMDESLVLSHIDNMALAPLPPPPCTQGVDESLVLSHIDYMALPPHPPLPCTQGVDESLVLSHIDYMAGLALLSKSASSLRSQYYTDTGYNPNHALQLPPNSSLHPTSGTPLAPVEPVGIIESVVIHCLLLILEIVAVVAGDAAAATAPPAPGPAAL